MKKLFSILIVFVILSLSFSSCVMWEEKEKDTEPDIYTETEFDTIIAIPKNNDDEKVYFTDAGSIDTEKMLRFEISGTGFYHSYGNATEQDIAYKKISADCVFVNLGGEYVALKDTELSCWLSCDGENTVLYAENNILPSHTYEMKFESEKNYYSFSVKLDNITEYTLKTEISDEDKKDGMPADSGIFDAWSSYGDDEHKRGITYQLSRTDYLILKEVISDAREPDVLKATDGGFECIAARKDKVYMLGENESECEETLLSAKGGYFTCCKEGPYVWIADMWREPEEKDTEDGYYTFVFKYADGCAFTMKEYFKQDLLSGIYSVKDTADA